jgi:Uma2 family endonuclease
MSAAPELDPVRDDEEDAEGDQIVVLHGISWELYEALDAARGDSARPRLTYCDGELEIMSPGFDHEDDKKRLARLIEAWAEESGTFLEGFGSWGLKRKKKKRAVEPDECYSVGRRPRRDGKPDFAIEVVKTSGGIPKLEVYRKIGVREVWFWKRGTLSFYELRGLQYTPIARSRLVPDLDVALVERCMRAESQTAGVAALRRAMRRKRR